MSGRNDDPTVFLALGACAGVYLFIKGFRVFRQLRVVEDTPAIPIRSIPMGLVHIRGKATGEGTRGVLPSIPATTITFSVMANACRIASDSTAPA